MVKENMQYLQDNKEHSTERKKMFLVPGIKCEGNERQELQPER